VPQLAPGGRGAADGEGGEGGGCGEQSAGVRHGSDLGASGVGGFYHHRRHLNHKMGKSVETAIMAKPNG
jgi:hypothetical protein